MPARAFNATIFTGDLSKGNKGYITYHGQTSLDRFLNFCNTKFTGWQFIWFYPKGTELKLLVKKSSLDTDIVQVLNALKM